MSQKKGKKKNTQQSIQKSKHGYDTLFSRKTSCCSRKSWIKGSDRMIGCCATQLIKSSSALILSLIKVGLNLPEYCAGGRDGITISLYRIWSVFWSHRKSLNRLRTLNSGDLYCGSDVRVVSWYVVYCPKSPDPSVWGSDIRTEINGGMWLSSSIPASSILLLFLFVSK